MLCQYCLRRSSALRRIQSSSKALLDNQISLSRTLTTTSTTSSPPRTPPSASTSASKPKTLAHPPSSVLADTSLKGLNYLKNKGDPIALPDEAYPPWLWNCLSDSSSSKKSSNSGEDTGDQFSKSAKQRRAAAKSMRKMALRDPDALLPKVPLHQQSVDLPGNEERSTKGALVAKEKREEVTKALRRARRSGIKEDNFLRGMR